MKQLKPFMAAADIAADINADTCRIVDRDDISADNCDNWRDIVDRDDISADNCDNWRDIVTWCWYRNQSSSRLQLEQPTRYYTTTSMTKGKNDS